MTTTFNNKHNEMAHDLLKCLFFHVVNFPLQVLVYKFIRNNKNNINYNVVD